MAVLVTRIRSSLLENVLPYSESWYQPLIMELDMTYLPIPFLEPKASSDEVMYARALESAVHCRFVGAVPGSVSGNTQWR